MDGEHTHHVDSQTMRQLTTCRHVSAGTPKNKTKTDGRLRKFWKGELPGIGTDWKF